MSNLTNAAAEFLAATHNRDHTARLLAKAIAGTTAKAVGAWLKSDSGNAVATELGLGTSDAAVKALKATAPMVVALPEDLGNARGPKDGKPVSVISVWQAYRSGYGLTGVTLATLKGITGETVRDVETAVRRVNRKAVAAKRQRDLAGRPTVPTNATSPSAPAPSAETPTPVSPKATPAPVGDLTGTLEVMLKAAQAIAGVSRKDGLTAEQRATLGEISIAVRDALKGKTVTAA